MPPPRGRRGRVRGAIAQEKKPNPGKKKQFGINPGNALLRTMANVKAKGYAERRILRDWKEYEKNPIPLVGVTAHPDANNLYVWHGNLKGPEGTFYKGGVFHFTINFPPDYPFDPPSITLATPLPHPCVSGTTVQLDLFDKTRKGLYEGWTSAYTALSVLMQLQSFLFEEDKEKKTQILEAVKKANEYVNLEIGHKGPLNPFPTFNQKENDLTLFKNNKTYKEIIQEELICYHSKVPLDSKTPLGVGVSISRLPRTGQIRAVEATLDLLSLKAFMKEGVRKSIDGTPFTHWLPLYFGTDKARTIYLLRKALAMICTGTTKRMDPNHILNVMPKLFLSLVLHIMEHNDDNPLRAIRILIIFYRTFVLLLDEYPELYAKIDEIIEKFKSDEKNRHKDNLSSLGDLLSYLIVSKKYQWKDVIGEYLGEQMDRQVFWILKDIPELESLKDDAELDEDKSTVSFQTGIIGFRITMFYSFFCTSIATIDEKKRIDIIKAIDDNLGHLSMEMESVVQKECKSLKLVKNYYEYFNKLGIHLTKKSDLLISLKKSIVNSKRKKYHGAEELINVVPEKSVLINEIMKNEKDIESFYDSEKKVFSSDENAYKNIISKKFMWLDEFISKVNPSLSLKPYEIAKLSDYRIENHGLLESDISRDKEKFIGIFSAINEETAHQEYPKEMTWRDLFIKLDFEHFLEYFQVCPDFKKYYRLMEIIKPYMKALVVKVNTKKPLKSGFNWITALMSKLTDLDALTLTTMESGVINQEFLKCFYKGANNFIELGGKLHKFKIMNPKQSPEYKLNMILKCFPELRCIILRDLSMTQGISQTISKAITDFKFIQELDLKKCNINASQAKDLADGLMRAKQIEILKLANNPSMGDSLSYIIYNLAFSPKISYLDISNISLSGNKANDNAEALFKLITIGGSLSVLLMDNTNLNNTLKYEFFKALGENKTIWMLSMVGSMFSNFDYMGKALGMNARKHGSLEHIRLSLSLNSYSALQTLVNGMFISDYDHEIWYGDSSVANQMSGEQRVKKLYNNLKTFLIGGGSYNLNPSESIYTIKNSNLENMPNFIKFMNSKSLEIYHMPFSIINKNGGEVMSYCLKNRFDFSKLKILNLSRNQLYKDGAKAISNSLSENTNIPIEKLDLSANKIGVSGTKALANALKTNRFIKVLNLFANIVDVDGARSLKEALLVNKTLEELDVGFNRLREKGLLALAEGIVGNPDGKLRSLGLRYNFIKDEGILKFFEKAVFGNQTKLDKLSLKYNYITEPIASEIDSKLAEKKKLISIDILDKIKYMNPEMLDRSIWISPLWVEEGLEFKIKNFFEIENKTGMVKEVRIRKGPKQNKPQPNVFGIIEFAHSNSVNRALRIASKKKAVISGKRIRIYKAGTRTQAIIKPPKGKKGR